MAREKEERSDYTTPSDACVMVASKVFCFLIGFRELLSNLMQLLQLRYSTLRHSYYMKRLFSNLRLADESVLCGSF